VDVNPILSFSPEFMPQISLNPQIQNYIDMPQIVNNIAMPQQQSIDLSPLAHLLDSIMLARQERTDLQSYGVTEMMTNTVIRQERDNRALDSLSERIEKLATAIENNKPLIYTQVIEGVPFHNAIRRAAAVANEL
jgi:gamma-glutamyl-gamma-aminobutyrate hydrolase PuuD